VEECERFALLNLPNLLDAIFGWAKRKGGGGGGLKEEEGRELTEKMMNQFRMAIRECII
jgi:hypothetical protein